MWFLNDCGFMQQGQGRKLKIFYTGILPLHKAFTIYTGILPLHKGFTI